MFVFLLPLPLVQVLFIITTCKYTKNLDIKTLKTFSCNKLYIIYGTKIHTCIVSYNIDLYVFETVACCKCCNAFLLIINLLTGSHLVLFLNFWFWFGKKTPPKPKEKLPKET